MSPPRRITKDSLKRAPRHNLLHGEQMEAIDLLEKADKRPWHEAELRKAAALEVKAWAIEKGEWNFELKEVKQRMARKDLFE
jgi:hypothetical protein